MSKKELAVTETRQESDMLHIIQQAVTSNVPVESLERLLAVKERFDAEQARRAYIEAISKFQGECPIIAKTKQGGKSKYAPLESIVSQVRGLLSVHGLSYRIEASSDGDNITATCIVTHILGHSESSSFTSKSESVRTRTGESVRSAMQDTAAALTFAKRYAFTNALGIMTGDEDTDADRPEDNEGILAELSSAKTKEELLNIWQALSPKARANAGIVKAAATRKAELAK